MAAYNVLYVAGGPTELVGIRALNFSQAKGTFVSTGDAAVKVYPGRAGPATGTVICEDAEKVAAIQAEGRMESAVFTCKDEAAGTVNVTCTGFVAGNISVAVTDGTGATETVVGFEVAFMADTVVIAPAA